LLGWGGAGRMFSRVEFTHVTPSDLEKRLAKYESKYGVRSEELESAFRDDQLHETADFQEWSITYSAWRAVTGRRHRRSGGQPEYYPEVAFDEVLHKVHAEFH
jgi:hypothetical protein